MMMIIDYEQGVQCVASLSLIKFLYIIKYEISKYIDSFSMLLIFQTGRSLKNKPYSAHHKHSIVLHLNIPHLSFYRFY